MYKEVEFEFDVQQDERVAYYITICWFWWCLDL
jgi:hypothetical protein